MPQKKTTNKTTAKKTTKKVTAKKPAVKKAAAKKKPAAKKKVAKKSTAKKSTVKKATKAKGKTAAKKATAKKATTKKPAVKKATPKKKAAAKKTTSNKKSTAKKSPAKKKTVAKKKATAKKSPAKKKPTTKKKTTSSASRAKISLEDLFATIETNYTDTPKSSVEKKGKTTPAYSTLFHSVKDVDKTHAQIAYEGAAELFEAEKDVYYEQQSLFHKLLMSMGVAMFAMVVGVMWFQVTKGYFENTEPLSESEEVRMIQGAVQENKKTFTDTEREISNIIKEAESLDENNPGKESISESLR